MDLEELVDEKLNITWQCALVTQNHIHILGCAKRFVISKSREEILSFYSALYEVEIVKHMTGLKRDDMERSSTMLKSLRQYRLMPAFLVFIDNPTENESFPGFIAYGDVGGFTQLQEDKVQRMPPWKYLGLQITARTIVLQKLEIECNPKTLADLHSLCGSLNWCPPVMIRDPETWETKGPYELVTWGCGYACMATPSGPWWIPKKCVKPFVPKNPAPAEGDKRQVAVASKRRRRRMEEKESS
ncbi:hypothetical protein DUI87_03571 [Hirundo rustica rustica]|uniref:Integrase-type domain-containing protein n=1 Tax=Hirundo rustica rustica TaxID=333673 RepID=A0A3M0L088_HIRRU|nr:hypothetical protein DUI87_03571 [Hirundo rustica rustica]